MNRLTFNSKRNITLLVASNYSYSELQSAIWRYEGRRDGGYGNWQMLSPLSNFTIEENTDRIYYQPSEWWGLGHNMFSWNIETRQFHAQWRFFKDNVMKLPPSSWQVQSHLIRHISNDRRKTHDLSTHAYDSTHSKAPKGSLLTQWGLSVTIHLGAVSNLDAWAHIETTAGQLIRQPGEAGQKKTVKIPFSQIFSSHQ